MMIDKVMMKSFDFQDKMLKESISKLDKEVRVTLDDCQQIGEDIATRMELPMDKWAIRTRHEFCEDVYHACMRLVTYQNEMSYKFVGAAVRGNLSSWYANALSTYKNAPHEWQSETEKSIINLFKSKYTLRKDELTNNVKSESLKEELLDIPDDKFDIIQNETDATFTTYDGKPFIIFYDWDQLSQVSDMLEEGAQKDEFDDSIILKYFDDYGFSDEWFVCQGLDEARPYQNNYIDDYAIIDGDIFSGDYIREYRDAARDYLTLIENNPKKINTILEDSQIEALGYKKVNDEAYENGWYGREDNPAAILKEMEEKYPNASIIFSKDSVGPFATTFNVFVKGATNGVEESLEEDKGNFKKSVPEYLWSDVCSNRLDKVKAYFERPNAQVNRRYNRFNMEHSLIMGALRNGNLEMVDLLKSFGETILDNEQNEFDELNLYYEEHPQYVRQSKSKNIEEELTEDTYGTKRYLVQIFDDGEWFDLNSSDDVYDAIKSGESAVEAVYQDYRILDTEDDNEEVDVGWYLENNYVLDYQSDDVVKYTFPKLTEEDKEYIKEYDLIIIEETNEDTVVEGRLEDILDFASDCLDYELVPDYIIEALYGKKEIDEFFSLCDKLGLKTFGDLKDFADNNKNRILVNDLLKNYDSSMSTDTFFQTLRDRVAEKDEFEYDDPLNVIKNKNRKNESLQLTEGHIVKEYKGFELDWNDDGIDPDEGEANFNVYIRYDGEEVTQDYGKELVFHGFNQAKRWIDENVKEVEYTPQLKFEHTYLVLSKVPGYDVVKNKNVLEVCLDDSSHLQFAIGIKNNKLYFVHGLETIVDALNMNDDFSENVLEYINLKYQEDYDGMESLLDDYYTLNSYIKDAAYHPEDDNPLIMYDDPLAHISAYSEVDTEIDDGILYKDTYLAINGKPLKESLCESKSKDKMYVGIWDDAKDDFVTYREFNSFGDALEFASKYDYSNIKSGVVKFDTNSLFTKGFASEFDIVDGKTDLKAMQELMPKNEDYIKKGDRVKLSSNKWHTDGQNDNIGRKGTVTGDGFHGTKRYLSIKADDERVSKFGYKDDGYDAYEDEVERVDESFDNDYEDDWEESNLYGGDLTYCPICNHKLVRDEDGDSYCPTCKEDSYSLSMKRRKNSKRVDENLTEDDLLNVEVGEIYDYIMSECREKRLVPMSKVREMFNSTSLSKKEIVEYLLKFYNDEGGYDGLIALDIDGDSYVGTPRLVQQRVEEVALMNKKLKSEEHSVKTITTNTDKKVEEVKSWLYDSTDDELKDVVDAVTSINVQIPNKQLYRTVARNIFGSENTKKYVYVNKRTEDKAKWAMSAIINFKKDKVDELPESIKSRLSTKNTISDIGLGIELFRMGAPLAKLKEEDIIAEEE